MYQRSLWIGITLVMIALALLGMAAGGPARTKPERPAVPAAGSGYLHVEIDHLQRVALDEVAARLDDVAHQRRENLVGLVGMVDPDLDH